MKLLSTYIKEMKIAARGFYFYIEIFFAIIIVLVLMLAVNENPKNNSKEFLYYDMPDEYVEYMVEDDLAEGTLKIGDPVTFDVKAQEFELTDEETGKVTPYDFDEGVITVKTYEQYDGDTGELAGTLYITDTQEDMMRLAFGEREIGATIYINDDNEVGYIYYNQGYETERFTNLLYILHNESLDTLEAAVNEQEVRSLGTTELLNARQNLVPATIVFMGSLMGFFIVMAYIFLDKDEGVIKAFAVTPSSVWKYLLSKTMVIMTTVLISSSIIVIPVMGGQPNYPMFYIFLITSTFAFASLGLLISSYYDSISKAFGALYAIMMVMIIPAFSYYIPSFDPLWLRFFPTYPMLQTAKEIIMVDGDLAYAGMYCAVFLVAGLLLFVLANRRFKKTLTV